jgi:hypothetical protein
MTQRSIPGLKIRFAGEGRLPFFWTGTVGDGLGAESWSEVMLAVHLQND